MSWGWGWGKGYGVWGRGLGLVISGLGFWGGFWGTGSVRDIEIERVRARVRDPKKHASRHWKEIFPSTTIVFAVCTCEG